MEFEVKYQANKHASSYWTNTIVAFSLSFGFYELSVKGSNGLTITAFSGAVIYFLLFSKWNYENWRLKNHINSKLFRDELKQMILPIVENNYTYKNALAHISSQSFIEALKLRSQKDTSTNTITLSIQPIEIELFLGSVNEFNINILFEIPEDDLSEEYCAYDWSSALLDTTLEPYIEG